jgi:hypothetical protein|tara:strand:+ start:214 stop:432 length:219 start_codon:yes stop_codon:yes gene_type:complete
LTSSPEQIEKIIDDMDKEVKSLKEDMFKICWFMRGGVNYSEIVMMSGPEREMMSKLIKENLETAKKTGQPFW